MTYPQPPSSLLGRTTLFGVLGFVGYLACKSPLALPREASLALVSDGSISVTGAGFRFAAGLLGVGGGLVAIGPAVLRAARYVWTALLIWLARLRDALAEVGPRWQQVPRRLPECILASAGLASGALVAARVGLSLVGAVPGVVLDLVVSRASAWPGLSSLLH